MSIFKSCDIRGVYGDGLTDDIMTDIGRGIVSMLRRTHDKPKIVVGGDIRKSTAGLKSALIAGMKASGAAVIDIGTVSTPIFYYGFRNSDADGCTMVTASHNPPKFNGLKLCFSEMPVTVAEIEELRRVVEQQEFTTGQGSVEHRNVISEYGTWLKSQFSGLGGMKIAIDLGGGAWSGIASGILAELGVDVLPLFDEVDPTLSVRNPNPLPQHLTKLCEAVVENGCRFGAAFDADGDRVVFVDERGRPVPSDIAGAVLARHMLAGEPGEKVVYEVNCSQALADAIAAAGGKPLMEKAGHAFMKRRMIDEHALFGVEISGHFFYRSLHGGDDGLYSALIMAKMLQASDQTLAELVDAVPHYFATPVVRLPRQSGEAQKIVDTIANNAAEGEVSRIDGVRVQYENGWALARVSVTEPVISLRFEAHRREDLPDIIHNFLGYDAALEQEVKDNLKL